MFQQVSLVHKNAHGLLYGWRDVMLPAAPGVSVLFDSFGRAQILVVLNKKKK